MNRIFLTTSIITCCFFSFLGQHFTEEYPDATPYIFDPAFQNLETALSEVNNLNQPVIFHIDTDLDTISFSGDLTITVPIMFEHYGSTVYINGDSWGLLQFENEYTSTYNVEFINIGINEHVVTNTNDSGIGSLRSAMIINNSISATIVFNIPGEAPHTIALDKNLPQIENNIYINGSRQSLNGYTGTERKIILDGSNVINDQDSPTTGGHNIGLRFPKADLSVAVSGIKFQNFEVGISSYSSAKHLNVSNCTFVSCLTGLYSAKAKNLTITGNLFGIDSENGTVSPNNLGLSSVGDTNVIIKNNVFSNNRAYGLYLLSSKNYAYITNNRIGTSVDGMSKAGTQAHGIYIAAGEETILGENVISGNDIGVFVPSGTPEFYGNKIGVNSIVTDVIPNSVGIKTQSGAIIGNLNRVIRPNIIAGNETGIIFNSNHKSNLTIENNFIGTNDEHLPLPNHIGIHITDSKENEDTVYIGDNVISSNETGVLLNVNSKGLVRIIGNKIGLTKTNESFNGIENSIGVVANGTNWNVGYNKFGNQTIHAIKVSSSTSHFAITKNQIGTYRAISTSDIPSSAIFLQNQSYGLIDNNTISYATGYGIEIDSQTMDNAQVEATENIFYGNELGGISNTWEDLIPEILSASFASVSGTSTPDSRIELYVNDSLGSVQGTRYLGSTKSDENGFWSYDDEIESLEKLTAIAIDTSLQKTRTSAFSELAYPITAIENNINNTSISVFPNPAYDQISIAFNNTKTGSSLLSIKNTMGFTVKEIVLDMENTTIDISNLDSGIYLIDLADDQKSETIRFVKH